MDLQFTLFGLIIIAVFYAICWAALAPLWRRVGERRWGQALLAVTALALAVLPWADEVYIASRFAELCKDSGVKVIRKVEADGYLYDLNRSSGTGLREEKVEDARAVAEFDKRGYRYVEYMLQDGRAWRTERTEMGLTRRVVDRPTARYHYRHAYQPSPHRYEEPMGWKLEKSEEVVVDSRSGEVIGRNVRYKRYPGWVEGLWIGLLGSGMTLCPDPEKGPRQPHFPEAVLIPAGKI